MGRNTEAVQLRKRACSVARKMHGEQHPAFAKAYNSVVSLLYKMGRHADALQLIEQAKASFLLLCFACRKPGFSTL